MAAKILLIDDDKQMCDLLASLLDTRGFKVIHLYDGKSGLELLKSGEVSDIVLLDIYMDGLNGIETLKEIRKNHQKNILPVIMISSTTDNDFIVNSLSSGGNDFVQKPINIEILLARIKTHLDLREQSLEFARRQELAAISAMNVTYHHEINNPLMIAIGTLRHLQKRHEDIDEKLVERISKSLDRIRIIVKNIDNYSKNDSVSYEEYVGETKKINLKND